MSQLKWLSEHTMLRDLAEVTGVGTFEDVTAVTDKPPAVVEVEDNDEYHLRFGTAELNEEDTNRGPDLELIGEMLDMVKSYDEENEPVHETENDAGVILQISKLNPNVPEFIPKHPPLNLSSVSKKEEDKENDNSSTQNNATQHSLTAATDIEETIQNLKAKIKSGLKSESPVRGKILRNAAIMSLLKLHSTKSPQPAKVKLLTPDHFMGNNSTKMLNDELSSIECRIPDTKSTEIIFNEIKNVKTSEPITSVEKVDKDFGDRSSEISSVQEETKDYNDESSKINATKEENQGADDKFSEDPVNVSIKKVDDWLSGFHVKEQKLRLHMGPITYKRKAPKVERIDPQSKSSTRSSSPQVSKIYVESELAKELYKEYKERSLKNAAMQEDIWAPVQREMRERDKKIKEKNEKSAAKEDEREN